MAILNLVFVGVVIENNISLVHTGTPVLLPTVATIALFLALQVVYYIVVRAQYLFQLRQALV